jgi:hypothetical protein
MARPVYLGGIPNLAKGTPGGVLRIDETSCRPKCSLFAQGSGMSLFRSIVHKNRLFVFFADDFIVEAYDLDTLRSVMTVNLAKRYPESRRSGRKKENAGDGNDPVC